MTDNMDEPSFGRDEIAEALRTHKPEIENGWWGGVASHVRGLIRLERQPLVAEVRRLRGLIKSAEWNSREQTGAYCPWCDHYADGRHVSDCPAFTPDGEVR